MDAPFSFLYVTDYHLGTPRSYRFRPAINRRWQAIKRQLEREDADLLLVGGDLTRDGDTHEIEYQWARENLETLPYPFLVIPGNQDVGNKHTRKEGSRPNRSDIALNLSSARLRLFSSYFGPINWTYLHRGVRFTGFYAAVAGSGLPEEKRFRRFMRRLAELPRGRHHVAMMHYWLYIDDVDEPSWDISRADQYLPWYFGIDLPERTWIFESLKASGVDLLFCGHVHTGRPEETVDGIRILKASAGGNTAQMTDRYSEVETRFGYYRCTVSASGIDAAFVPGADQSAELDGYGPGGHAPISERDYSLAREKPALRPDPWLLLR